MFWKRLEFAEQSKIKGNASDYVKTHNLAFSFILSWRICQKASIFDSSYLNKSIIEMLVEVEDQIFINDVQDGLYELAGDGSGRTNKQVIEDTDRLIKEKVSSTAKLIESLKKQN